MVTEAKTADRARLRSIFDFRYTMPSQVLEIPAKMDSDSVHETGDDLAEIYDELQRIAELNEARYIDDAVWEARGGYIEDWGYYVVSLQAALWKYVAEAAIDAEEAASPEP